MNIIPFAGAKWEMVRLPKEGSVGKQPYWLMLAFEIIRVELNAMIQEDLKKKEDEPPDER